MHIVSCPIDSVKLEALEMFIEEDESCAWSLEFDARGKNPLLNGYFESPAGAEEAYAALQQAFPGLPQQPQYSEIEEREWQDAYKAYLHPWHCGELHWIPVWLKDSNPVPPAARAVYFDAGMAFGTGSHETTRLMARRLLDFKGSRGAQDFARSNIVDAGCGSGILAISAAVLGCARISGFDCDPEAVRVSRENVQANQLPEDAVRFYQAGLSDGFCHGPYDFVMANIQADVLMANVAALAGCIAGGGTLAMSGILTGELDSVKACFDLWLADQAVHPLVDSVSDGEWADLCYTFA